MERAVVSLRSSESPAPPSKSTRGRQKRKRTSDGDAASNNATSAARPRDRPDHSTHSYESTFQLASPARTDAAYTLSSAGFASAATKTPPASVAVLSGPGRVPVHEPVTGLQTQPQTYQEYRLHSTNSGPSGHSCAQDRCAEPIFRHDNGAMPIARAEVSTAYTTHRSTELPLSTTYNPHFQWYAPGQPGDAIAQSHIHQVPLSSPPQSVPQQLIHINGAVYPHHFNPVSPQPLDLLSQDNVHATIADANHAASFHTFQPQAFGLNQPLGSGEGVHLHLEHQPHPHSHHPENHEPLFLTHPGAEQLGEKTVPFQASQVSSIPYPAYSDPQFIHHTSADTKPLGYSFSTPMPTSMGGGRYFPESHQEAPGNGYLAEQPIGQLPIISRAPGSAVSDIYTGSGAMVNGAVHAQEGTSYEQHTDMTGIAGWQEPVSYITAEAHQDSGDECKHVMPNDSTTSDAMDTDGDVHGGLPKTSGGPEESTGASTMEKEEASSSLVLKPRRSPLSPAHRKQTAETRKIKACTRCRMQKMRCETDAEDPTGDCVGCRTFSKTSKKTIHKMPCYRGKITDAILFRSGGLELTKRWKGTEMKDVGDRINPTEIRTIKFTLGICEEVLQVEVVAFQARPGDVTARYWIVPDDEHGVRKKKDLAHYCLADIQKTATYFEEYIKKNAVEVMQRERAGGKMRPRNIIELTYAYVIGRYQDLVGKSANTGSEEREIKFLGKIFILWFAMRHSTGSSWICGEELLGMKPETRDETYPLFGRVSVPRMILAQFDSITHTRLLSKYGKLVLSELESLMSRSHPQHFFMIYACLFILLREASWISEDRYRHARNNHGQSLRYSIPKFVENLHESCNNLLQHWHYFNCKAWPDPTEAADRFKSHLAGTSPTEYDLLMQAYTDPAVQRQLDVWRRYKEENGHVDKATPSDVGGRPYEGRQVCYDWDHPFYWISQLFEENWQPHATYQRECTG